MIWLTIALIVGGLVAAALLFGADTRDGRDWQSTDGLPSPLPVTDRPPLYSARSRCLRPARWTGQASLSSRQRSGS